MKLDDLLQRLFPRGSQVSMDGSIVSGTGETSRGPVAVAGTVDGVRLGARELLALSDYMLRVMRETPGRPILLLVDTAGQAMALQEELLGLNEYLAHCVKVQDAARRRGHRVIALVYGQAVAGAFIAFGLCAGRTCAVPEADISVMPLAAIARVTKRPLEQLEALAAGDPVFAPGLENFLRTGGLYAIWDGDLNAHLEEALRESQDDTDRRDEWGARRGGRIAAFDVARRVVDA